MKVGRDIKKKLAMTVLNVDSPINEDIKNALTKISGVKIVKSIVI